MIIGSLRLASVRLRKTYRPATGTLLTLGAVALAAAISVQGQCIDGIPAGYPISEQVAIHILDPDCSFDPKWRRHLADPFVDSVGLIYHDPLSTQSLELMQANPSMGQALAVWTLDGKISKPAITTTASDVGGDFSAFVLAIQDGGCGAIRIGSVVTTPERSATAGLVRKLVEGPQCVLHVIKPSSLRPLLAVRIPEGAQLVKLSDGSSQFGIRQINMKADSLALQAETPGTPSVKPSPLEGAVPLVVIAKKGFAFVGREAFGEDLSKYVVSRWGDSRPLLRSTGVRESGDIDWTRTPLLPGADQQVVVFLDSGFWTLPVTVSVQGKNVTPNCVQKMAAVRCRACGLPGIASRYADKIVDYLSKTPCLMKSPPASNQP